MGVQQLRAAISKLQFRSRRSNAKPDRSSFHNHARTSVRRARLPQSLMLSDNPLYLESCEHCAGGPELANEHYVVVTVQCPMCIAKQKIHVSTIVGGIQLLDQTIQCLYCDGLFKATVTDKIIRGPFPM